MTSSVGVVNSRAVAVSSGVIGNNVTMNNGASSVTSNHPNSTIANIGGQAPVMSVIANSIGNLNSSTTPPPMPQKQQSQLSSVRILIFEL